VAGRPADPRSSDGGAVIGDRAFAVVGLFAVALVIVGLVAALLGVGSPHPPGGGSAAGGSSSTAASPGASSTASPDTRTFLYAQARDAAPIELVDPAAQPFSLAALRGAPVLVFFGYTHCPDVCPATIGIVGKTLASLGDGSRAVFVTIDPERDTTAWLTEYSQYLPAGFTAVTGSASQIRATADAWGVKYARVETDRPDAYSMSHTADVFLIDAAGRLRGSFPFGTTADQMVATVKAVLAGSTAVSGTPAPGPSATPAGAGPTPAASALAPSTVAVYALKPTIVSSSIWAGGHSPVILTLDGPAGRLNDPTIIVTAQLIGADGAPVGPAVPAVAVRPPLEDRVLYVPTVDIPAAGAWRLEVKADTGATALRGTADLTALDPGSTSPLGGPAPTARTPTLADAGGDRWAVTTDPAPDLRLSSTSTVDALAEGAPFVLVADSVRFRVSPACGKAVVMARYLLDRWPAVRFIHLEPFRYSVVAETPVLEGSLADPQLTDPATAWGFGGAPWGARSMPWVYVVDGHGIVRAKYQGIVGSDDVDVILALIAQGG
jgi:protein SCO1/2